METGRIFKTLESETRDFITHDTTSHPNLSIFVLVSRALRCHRVTEMGLEEACTCSVLLHSRVALSFGNPLIL